MPCPKDEHTEAPWKLLLLNALPKVADATLGLGVAQGLLKSAFAATAVCATSLSSMWQLLKVNA